MAKNKLQRAREREAAAIVAYVECPTTRQLVALPTGVAPAPWQQVRLIIDVN